MKKPAPKIDRTSNCSSYNRVLINRGNIAGGVLKSMLTLNEAIIDVKEG